MNNDVEIDLLKYTLNHKNPILVLGAGFSIGAVNNRGKSLLTGKKLAEEIYIALYEKNSNDKSHQNKDDAKLFSNNLKDLCSLIRSEGEERIAERNQWLTTQFTGCKSKKDFHQYLVEYPWKKIFTLNIDDLLENLYRQNKKKYHLFNSQIGKNERRVTTLIKLHGDVHFPEKGYIFDETEYHRFSTQQNYLLREYADACMKNDVILLGIEYQEDDLKQIIQTYSISGYKENSNYFFISPKIGDPILRSKIKNTDNYHLIEWTTEQFLEFLHTKIIYQRDLNSLILEKGMVMIDDEESKGSAFYNSSLYTGVDSRYCDFWQNWNIIYPPSENWIEEILSSENNQLVCIFGKPYVGKTCTARHILVSLSRNNFICREYIINGTQSVETLLDYLETLPDNSYFALLCENAAYNYCFISDFLKNLPKNIKKCVVIAVDTETNHKRKRYSIETDLFMEYEVSEKINHKFAVNIINKLSEHHWLGKLQSYCSNKDESIRYATETDDIIDFLYLATSGRGFEEYFKDLLRKKNNETTQKFFSALIVLGALGITLVPIRIFVHILPSITTSLNFKVFLDDYDDFITVVDNKYIKLRCLRVLQGNNIHTLDKENIQEMLNQVIEQTVGQFTENSVDNESNESYELFQKALLVKNILSEHIMDLHQAHYFFNSIEKICTDYSYYWVQRGLLEQKNSKFEAAENYLLKAQSIRPNSYQVRHAIAKNFMERGLFEIKNYISDFPSYYFKEGVELMKELALDPMFSKAYAYSVHALIDMQLRYAELDSSALDYDDCNFMATLILKAPLDKYTRSVARKFKKFCLNNNYIDIADRIYIPNSKVSDPNDNMLPFDFV